MIKHLEDIVTFFRDNDIPFRYRMEEQPTHNITKKCFGHILLTVAIEDEPSGAIGAVCHSVSSLWPLMHPDFEVVTLFGNDSGKHLYVEVGSVFNSHAISYRYVSADSKTLTVSIPILTENADIIKDIATSDENIKLVVCLYDQQLIGLASEYGEVVKLYERKVAGIRVSFNGNPEWTQLARNIYHCNMFEVDSNGVVTLDVDIQHIDDEDVTALCEVLFYAKRNGMKFNTLNIYLPNSNCNSTKVLKSILETCKR